VSSESTERDSSNYDSLSLPGHSDAGRQQPAHEVQYPWLPAVEIVGQPLSDVEPADGGAAMDETANQASTPGVPDLIEQIREQDDALDELVMAAEWAYMYRSERAFERLREALIGWREASGEPR
jgi:hypothetical protein